MKTLKQIIEEVQQYQCTEGSKADCELRTLAIRVNVLREIFDIIGKSHGSNETSLPFENGFDSMLLMQVAKPSFSAMVEKLQSNMDPYTVFEIKRTFNISGNREELLAKYDGKDKEFVERVIRETDEYFNSVHGK